MSVFKSEAICQIVSCLENEVQDLGKENQMMLYFVPASFAKNVYLRGVSWT